MWFHELRGGGKEEIRKQLKVKTKVAFVRFEKQLKFYSWEAYLRATFFIMIPTAITSQHQQPVITAVHIPGLNLPASLLKGRQITFGFKL